MGKYKNKAYSLRLDEDIMAKLRYIAEKEERPLSNQFKLIVKEYLERYESNHGEINQTVINNGTMEIGIQNNGNKPEKP